MLGDNIIIAKDSRMVRKSKRDTELLQQKLIESIHQKTMKDVANEDLPTMKRIDPGWRLLWSYDFEGNELEKYWGQVSSWSL
ncbi:MAG: hypothetical protein M3299_14720 [Thermoproteota archaeon]|nr:hypothetical protein [Thermoproteota archaeon]